MSSRVKVSTIIGGVVLLATIFIFVLAYPVILPSTILGLVFLLYGEIAFFAGFALVDYWASKSSGIMTRAGMGITIGAYAIAVCISSVIYMNLHIVLYRGFLILQILLFVCAATVSLIFGVVSKSKAVNDSKVLKSDEMVRGFVNELILVRDMTDKKASIDKLVEAMKYTDTSVMVDADVEIDEALVELKNIIMADELDELRFNKDIEKIEFLIKKRNLQTRSAKQGGI